MYLLVERNDGTMTILEISVERPKLLLHQPVTLGSKQRIEMDTTDSHRHGRAHGRGINGRTGRGESWGRRSHVLPSNVIVVLQPFCALHFAHVLLVKPRRLRLLPR